MAKRPPTKRLKGGGFRGLGDVHHLQCQCRQQLTHDLQELLSTVGRGEFAEDRRHASLMHATAALRCGVQTALQGYRVTVAIKGGDPGGSRRPPSEPLMAGDIQGGGPNVVVFEGVEVGLIRFTVIAVDAGWFFWFADGFDVTFTLVSVSWRSSLVLPWSSDPWFLMVPFPVVASTILLLVPGVRCGGGCQCVSSCS